MIKPYRFKCNAVSCCLPCVALLVRLPCLCRPSPLKLFLFWFKNVGKEAPHPWCHCSLCGNSCCKAAATASPDAVGHCAAADNTPHHATMLLSRQPFLDAIARCVLPCRGNRYWNATRFNAVAADHEPLIGCSFLLRHWLFDFSWCNC